MMKLDPDLLKLSEYVTLSAERKCHPWATDATSTP
jgi:hypothetical protein